MQDYLFYNYLNNNPLNDFCKIGSERIINIEVIHETILKEY